MTGRRPQTFGVGGQTSDQIAERRTREGHRLRHEQERAEPLFKTVPRVDEPVRHAHEDARERLLQHDIRELHGEDRERQAVGARGRFPTRHRQAAEEQLQRREER